MKVQTYSETRANFARTLEGVEDDHEEVIITRTGHEPIVMIALSEWESLRETFYLSQGANGRQLRQSIARLEAGNGVEHELIDGDE